MQLGFNIRRATSFGLLFWMSNGEKDEAPGVPNSKTRKQLSDDKDENRLVYMVREMRKRRNLVKYSQAEAMGGKEREGQSQVEWGGGKEREGKLSAEIYRLTFQRAVNNVAQGGNAGEQPAKPGEVTDDAISESAELQTSKVVGNSKPNNSYAMDTGTSRKGAGGKA